MIERKMGLIKNNLLSLVVVMGLIVLGVVLAGDVIVDLNQGSVEVADDLVVSGDAVVDGRMALGVASVNDRLLNMEWAPVNDNAAYGLFLNYLPSTTTGSGQNYRGISTDVTPNVSSGETMNSVDAIRGSFLTDANLVGDLNNLHSMNFLFGANTGTVGTINNAYGVKIKAYQKSGTINNSYGLYFNAPVTGGTVNNEWVIYSDDNAPSRFFGDVQIDADNKKLLLGADNDASVYWDGTNLVIEGGNLDVNGEVDASGVSGDGTGKVVCVKSDGDLGTCSDAPDGSGVCSCG